MCIFLLKNAEPHKHTFVNNPEDPVTQSYDKILKIPPLYILFHSDEEYVYQISAIVSILWEEIARADR